MTDPLRIHVALSRAPYDVLVGDGLVSRIGELVRKTVPGKKAALLTDSNVAPLHAAPVRTALEAAGIAVTEVVVPAGEASKSMAVADDCCRAMIRGGLDRKSFLIALGGGVVGDLAGFVAAIYYRGIPFLQIPTTIVAQVDSSVGGKTGVNAPEGKNLIGAFHQPAAVLADTVLLETLPPREFNEGMAEVIKHAAIRDAAMLEDILALDPASRSGLAPLVARNVAIKARIVEADEKETLGLRALLNFGHTIGHAIEAEAGYGKMLHGEAIALGLRAALELSVEKSGLDPAFARRCLEALAHFDLPLVLPQSFHDEALLAHLARDKKFEDGAIRFVLLDAPGSAFVSKEVTLADIRKAIARLRTEYSFN
jgi:3-dehydroquinate synthase